MWGKKGKEKKRKEKRIWKFIHNSSIPLSSLKGGEERQKVIRKREKKKEEGGK